MPSEMLTKSMFRLLSFGLKFVLPAAVTVTDADSVHRVLVEQLNCDISFIVRLRMES